MLPQRLRRCPPLPPVQSTHCSPLHSATPLSLSPHLRTPQQARRRHCCLAFHWVRLSVTHPSLDVTSVLRRPQSSFWWKGQLASPASLISRSSRSCCAGSSVASVGSLRPDSDGGVSSWRSGAEDQRKRGGAGGRARAERTFLSRRTRAGRTTRCVHTFGCTAPPIDPVETPFLRTIRTRAIKSQTRVRAAQRRSGARALGPKETAGPRGDSQDPGAAQVRAHHKFFDPK